MRTTRELLGAAAALTANVLVVTCEAPDADQLSSWGADAIAHLDGENVEEDVARAVTQLASNAAVGDPHRVDGVGPRSRRASPQASARD